MRDPFRLDLIEEELRFHRVKLGTNAIRVFYGSIRAPLDAVSVERLKGLLCAARRQGIRVHFAFLVAVPPGPEEHDVYVAGYRAFLESLIPELRDDPTVLAYEIGNEMLNETHYGQRALRMIRALISVIRSLDPNHLITSGEVAGVPFPYPSPEFIPLFIDGPTNPPVTLEGLVDYISPHFYNFAPWEAKGGLENMASAIREATSKPIVAGEFGYSWPDEMEHVKNYYQEPQRAFFERWNSLQRTVCAESCAPGAVKGFDGWMPWLPFPILDLRPDRFEKKTHTHHPWPVIRLLDENRLVHYRDQWDLFYYPDNSPTTPLTHLPAGLTLRKSKTTKFDFGGDSSADVAIFTPSTGQWRKFGGEYNLGESFDVIVPADYDGDGRTAPAVFRPSTGEWLVRDHRLIVFGRSGDIPVPGDYDGDAEADSAVFRPSDASWQIMLAGATVTRSFGAPGDIPVAADYNADGAADLGVYAPSTGTWSAVRLDGTALFTGVQWGAAGDIPVAHDYDGDGAANLAVYRPSTSAWWIWPNVAFTFGRGLPVPGDYDGDGVANAATYSAADGVWEIEGVGSVVLGDTEDIPIPLQPASDDAAFVRQAVPVTMVAGQVYPVSVTFRNTGTRAFNPIGPICQAFRLIATNPWGNTTWGIDRAELPGPVDRGREFTASFEIRAPETPGYYNFQWRVVQECVQGLGEPSANVVIKVE